MQKTDKLILGGAFVLGVAATLKWYMNKRGVADPLAPPWAQPGGPLGPTRAPSSPSTYRAPPAATSKAAPVPSSQGGDAPDAPTIPAEDPQSMTASFGDTPAIPAGQWYDTTSGG